MIDLYDHEELAARKIMEELSYNIGTSRNVEGFIQEVIHRFELIGLIVEPRTFWDDRNKCYWNEFEITGRTEPEKYGFDFDRQTWEIRKDIAGIEPDKVDIKPPKFNPELLHADNPAKVVAKAMDTTVTAVSHGHGKGGTHTHEDGTTHSHD
jgi:hypothetical protein